MSCVAFEGCRDARWLFEQRIDVATVVVSVIESHYRRVTVYNITTIRIQ